MNYTLEERVGNPDLFTGRKEELAFLLKWINDIKERKSQSTATLARHKIGKTALMERLFNITFDKNDGVIPFYYEIKENDIWIIEFCMDFFLTFIYRYIAFKSRKIEYLIPEEKHNFEKVKTAAVKERLDYLTGIIDSVEYAVRHEYADGLWEMVKKQENIDRAQGFIFPGAGLQRTRRLTAGREVLRAVKTKSGWEIKRPVQHEHI